MTFATRIRWLSVMFTLSTAVLLIGCTRTDRTDQKKKDDAQAKTSGKVKIVNADMKGGEHEHGAWWCDIHGIPEHICGLCNRAYRDEQKAKGDWCEDHKRLKSQCFKCDPTLYERVFEPMYMEKYNGKKPERPPEKEFKK